MQLFRGEDLLGTPSLPSSPLHSVQTFTMAFHVVVILCSPDGPFLLTKSAWRGVTTFWSTCIFNAEHFDSIVESSGKYHWAP